MKVCDHCKKDPGFSNTFTSLPEREDKKMIELPRVCHCGSGKYPMVMRIAGGWCCSECHDPNRSKFCQLK